MISINYKKLEMNYGNKTITLTFGDVGENGIGMQKIGTEAVAGYGPVDLVRFQTRFQAMGLVTRLINLDDLLPGNVDYGAKVLIITGGANALVSHMGATSDDLFAEQIALPVDKKALMYGRVVNKIARHNLCFAPGTSQEPNYKEGKGRIVAFESVPLTNHVRTMLNQLVDPTIAVCEGNYYYDVTKCGIGFHGDAERKKVIGLRLGSTMPIVWRWYQNSRPISQLETIQLAHGDIYIMSEKATGHDCALKKIPILKHAAGCAKYIG